MHIFITGGTGFIGRRVVEGLLRGNDALLLLVRDPKKAKKTLPQSKNINFLKADLRGLKKVEPAIKKFKPDICIHLAWEGIPDYGLEMSLKNFYYGLELMRILGEVGCKKVVAAGTCAEYGDKIGKVSEDDKIDPNISLGTAKAALYILGKEISRVYGMKLVWARFFYIYGEGRKSKSLIQYLLECARKGLPPDIKNKKGGNDFLHVEDVAEAVLKLTRSKSSEGIYNVGFGKLVAVQDVADMIYGKKIIKPRRSVGFYADISKIKKETGWKPHVTIEKGIKNILNKYN